MIREGWHYTNYSLIILLSTRAAEQITDKSESNISQNKYFEMSIVPRSSFSLILFLCELAVCWIFLFMVRQTKLGLECFLGKPGKERLGGWISTYGNI